MRQASLFDILPPADPNDATGLAGMIPSIRAVMNRVAGKEDDGRALLLDRLNAIAKRENVPLTKGGGKEIKIDTFNKWLQASDKEHIPSLEGMVCFCLASGNASPFKALLDILGLVVIPREELGVLQYGKACRGMKKAKEELKNAEALLYGS